MGVKMNLRITKNNATDPNIWFLTKSISKSYDGHAASVGVKLVKVFSLM